ncbi:MAG: TlpA family protein disulfide reductase, partial [Acidimicrobiia bacterium]
LVFVGVAFDDAAAAAREWVDAADPRPTFPVLLDREHLLTELYGIYNVPTVVWVDEDDRIARSPVIAPGDDMFRDFTNIDSAVHHDQLRAWVRDDTLPAPIGREQVMLPTDDEQLARLERRVGAYLARVGRTDAAEPHFARAAELAPMDWTIRRGSMPLRGGDPFGEEFFAFMGEWTAAGAPGYGSADPDAPA